jgi:threonine dehydrogenase-like Zn-dependent dehydrogenase
VAVTDVDDARIERPSDAIVRIAATNICGSDLHMYEGRTDFEPGRTFGHENLGPYQGGQAEYLRVPWADFNALRLPGDAEEKQADYVMVADIFPTGGTRRRWRASSRARPW